MKRKKRNFVLLEVLIAFAIVSCCILPFLHEPFTQLKNELNMLFEMKLQLLAQEELSKLEINLLENRVDASHLFSTKHPLHREEPLTLKLGKTQQTFVKKTSIFCEKQQTNEETHWALVTCKVTYSRKVKGKDNAIVSAHTEVVAQKKL